MCNRLLKNLFFLNYNGLLYKQATILLYINLIYYMLKSKLRELVGNCPYCGITYLNASKKPFRLTCSICSYPIKHETKNP